MAGADYFHCSVCRRKTFYDANVSYEDENLDMETQTPVPDGDVGRMVVLCRECAKKYKVRIYKNVAKLRKNVWMLVKAK